MSSAAEGCCSVLQCVAVCCSVWQRVAACCSVLLCIAACCIKLPGVPALLYCGISIMCVLHNLTILI